MFLAYYARACATLFSPLLVQQIVTHCRPISRWRTLSTTFPNKVRSATIEEVAFITFTLSPSITSSENLTSVANYIAFLHANNSTSSLLLTDGPLVAMATITSPLSFRIIALNQDMWIFEKIAASKFSLKTDRGGGFQTSLMECTIEATLSWTCDTWYSSKYLVALLLSQLGSWSLPPCNRLFLWFQMNHAWMKNYFSSCTQIRFSRYSMSSIMLDCPWEHFCNFDKLPDHTSFATSQSHKACMVVFGNLV